MHNKPISFHRLGILEKIFFNYKDQLSYEILEEDGIVKVKAEENIIYNVFYNEGYYWIVSEYGGIVFKTKSKDRLESWLWKYILKKKISK